MGPRLRLVVLVVLVVIGWVGLHRLAGPTLTAATFNIRMFPEESTASRRVAELLAQLDADILAVQEIRDEDALLDVLAVTSALTHRDYGLVLASCGGLHGLSTGLVYDRARLTLLASRQFREHDAEDRGSCARGHRPAMLAVFEGEGHRVAVLSTHLQAGAEPERLAVRRRQWDNTIAILRETAMAYDAQVLALGDFNSTGWRDNAGHERDFIHDTIRRAGLHLATEDVPCTAYWQPEGPDGAFVPSNLDHIVVSGDGWSNARPFGMCAQHACKPVPADSAPPDYLHVSDHCPLRVDLE